MNVVSESESKTTVKMKIIKDLGEIPEKVTKSVGKACEKLRAARLGGGGNFKGVQKIQGGAKWTNLVN